MWKVHKERIAFGNSLMPPAGGLSTILIVEKCTKKELKKAQATPEL